MSQEQPRRPQQGGGGGGGGEDNQEQRPVVQVIKYGDVFNVSGELALETIAPGDAALVQIAEINLMGRTFPGGPAEKMLSAATYNERAGVVDYADVSHVVANQGIDLTETAYPGVRIISESVAGQMIGQYVKPVPVDVNDGRVDVITIGEALEAASLAAGDKPVDQSDAAAIQAAESRATGSDVITPVDVNDGRVDVITIGEALEAASLAAGDKPVDQSDAAAIQAAESRATGSDVITPGGVAAAAQSAANANTRFTRDEDKYKIAEILTDAAAKLPADKPATRGDADGVMSAELRNNPNLVTHPGGVADAVVSAARLNQQQGI